MDDLSINSGCILQSCDNLCNKVPNFLADWKYLLGVPSLCYCFLIATFDNQSCLNKFKEKQSVKQPLFYTASLCLRQVINS